MQNQKRQESNFHDGDKNLKSNQYNPFYNGEVISIREALKQKQSQPQYIHHQISSNVNRAVNKYSGANRELDDLQQQVIQLQDENKIKTIEIQRLTGEKELLMKSALSANQKLKLSRKKDQEFAGRDNINYPKTDSSFTMNQSQYIRRQSQHYKQNNSVDSQEIINENSDSPGINDVLILQTRVAKLELQIQQLILKNINKDQGLIELLDRLKLLDKSFNKNDFKKYISLIDQELVQLDKATLNQNQIQSSAKRFINLYRDTSEILGFTVSAKPMTNSSLVMSQPLEGAIQSIKIISAEGKCLQVTINSAILDSQNGKIHQIIHPHEPLQSKEKIINFDFPEEIIQEKQKFLQEVWFHELIQEKVLLAEINVKIVLVVDEKKLERISSRIEILNQNNQQTVENQNPIYFSDTYLDHVKQTLRIHDMIIYTNQIHFYGIQAIYWDGRNFHHGDIMKGANQIQQDELEGVVAVNKVPKNRYSKSRILQSIQYFKNKSNSFIEKIILGYQIQNSSNSTTTKLNCELGTIQPQNKYDTIKLDIKPGMIIQAQFLLQKNCSLPSQIMVSDINLI